MERAYLLPEGDSSPTYRYTTPFTRLKWGYSRLIYDKFQKILTHTFLCCIHILYNVRTKHKKYTHMHMRCCLIDMHLNSQTSILFLKNYEFYVVFCWIM